jgi:hypothetical protein
VQRAQVLADPVEADLQATMILVHFLKKIMNNLNKSGGLCHAPEIRDGIV